MNQEYVFLPTTVENFDHRDETKAAELNTWAGDDSDKKKYLKDMPNNYFKLFTYDEIIEHFRFIKENSSELKIGNSIKIRRKDRQIVICERGLERFQQLIEKVENSNKRIVHHHAFVPAEGNFQIVFIQTTDEHIELKDRVEGLDEFKSIVESVKLSLVRSPLELFTKRFPLESEDRKKKLEEFQIERKKKIRITKKLGELVSDPDFGDPQAMLKALNDYFYPNLNAAFRKGVDNGKIAELASLYIQLAATAVLKESAPKKNLDAICCIRPTASGALRLTFAARSPIYMKSQKYLSFITQRLRYYQTLGHDNNGVNDMNFVYRGGFSTFVKSSEQDQIEMSVFYFMPKEPTRITDGNEQVFLENELLEDLKYKVVPRFNELSLFDILGPRMIGPSSSHTAGANRIGQLARNIIVAGVNSGKLSGNLHLACSLFDSFKETGEGHGTPSALAGGLLEQWKEYDPRIYTEAEKFIKSKGTSHKFGSNDIKWCGIIDKDFLDKKKNYHANSAIILVNDCNEFKIKENCLLYIVGESYGGGNVQIREIGGRIVSEKSPQPRRITFDTVKRDSFIGKKDEILQDLFGNEKIERIFDYPSESSVIFSDDDRKEIINRRPRVVELDDIAWYCRKKNRTIAELALDYERSTQKIFDSNLIKMELDKAIKTMLNSLKEGLRMQSTEERQELFDSSKPEERKQSEFPVGNGRKLDRYISGRKELSKNLYLRTAAYALAVNERNAAHEQIVAAPTAGASGIVPGVLKALWEENNLSRDDVYKGLLTAAFIGLVINNIVPTAGASHGCQAEIGVGCGMAAAMAAAVTGCDTDTILNSAALALKSNLGLVCDPIAGKVEIPCIKRNGFKAVESLIAADMARAGIKSAVTPSEVVKAMDEIGSNMKAIYKETSKAGLAATIWGRDAKRCRNCQVKTMCND